MANILGINLSEINEADALKKATDFLNGNSAHYIVTPNPEIVLCAHKDEELFYILNKADLSLADGIGLKIAAWVMNEKVYRITGADFTLKLLEIASEQKIKTLILNWSQGLSSDKDIYVSLKNKYPNLDFIVLSIEREKYLNIDILNKINDYSPKLVFNSLGFPWQEKLIYHNISKLPGVRLMIGIGGSFDFISGKIRRAPKFMRYLGLEWFWRLINAANYKNSLNRLKRIYRATFVFMFKIIKSRFLNPYLYRPNVACFLYKKEAGEIKILLVERADEKGHWQLPQGGTDGEDLKTAGARELREETNITSLISKAACPDLFKYLFSKKPAIEGRKFYKYDYKGQKQGLYIAEFIGNDSEIKINFWDHQNWQWAEIDKIISIIDPIRVKSFRIYLEKFKSLNL